MTPDFIDGCVFKLIERLDKIAKLNGDNFDYGIEINQYGKKAVRYIFTATEITDRHIFISGTGVTILDTLLDAASGITNACKLWDYKEK